MGTTATVTIDAVSYDVYALTADPVQDTIDYLAGKLGASSFAALSADDQKRALVSATRWLDRLQWTGSPTDTTTPQPLEHPRTGLIDCNSVAIDDSEVATGVVEAMFELAEIIAADSTTQNSSGQGSNIKSVGAGSAQVEFFRPTIGSAADTRLPTVAQDLIRCFLAGTTITKATATGTGNSSAFDSDDFERSEGYY